MDAAVVDSGKRPAPEGPVGGPGLVEVAESHGAVGLAPRAPTTLEDTGLDLAVLKDLALKLAHTTYNFSTEWAAERMHLPVRIVEEILQGLVRDKLLEILGQVGPFTYRYTITNRGSEEAGRLLQVSGYIGPTPVSLDSYTSMLEWQVSRFPSVRPQEVAGAIKELILSEESMRIACLSLATGRSLFLSGPPGNGKTALGRLLHGALKGELWIPHAVAIDSNVIRIYDPLAHRSTGFTLESAHDVDARWVKVQRPLVIAGGELTIHALELSYSPSLRYYEAPLHVKANGGIFFIDDFGRQRVNPNDLLNRWIVPLEYGIDHLTLHTGQQIRIPFRQMLIIATNLNLSKVADAAFLRRIGYRVHLDNPTALQYEEIFQKYAARKGLTLPPGLVPRLLERYKSEQHDPRCCHPRDLVDRVLDICTFRGEAPRIEDALIDQAWFGYFGPAGVGLGPGISG